MDISVLSILLLSAFILTAAKAKPQGEDDRNFDDQDRDFSFDTQDRLPNNNDELESRSLGNFGLGGLGRYQANNFGGLLGSLGGSPSSQSQNGILGQNINQNINQGLFSGFPGSLNSILAPQNLIGAATGQTRSNPNLIGGQSGLIGSFPGLLAGNRGLGNISPPSALIGSSPFGDIMAMASFLTSDELKDMFSEDKNFNFIPVIQPDINKQREDQEIQQFIRFLNSRQEKEEESLGSANSGFEKRGQRSLATNPSLEQQLIRNAIQQKIVQQNLLQSILLNQNRFSSGSPNSVLPQQNFLQGADSNPFLALQANQNSRFSGSQSQLQSNNPLLALQSTQNSRRYSSPQSQLQSSPNNIFPEPLLSQAYSNQAPNGFVLNPITQQALLQNAQLHQQQQLQALQQQILLQSSRDSRRFGRSEQEVSALLPLEHKQEPFRFPNQ